ncbi:uncharacterized protein LOC143589583 [Bidens hawaiensis]|uniref:uncharacterized protein LOC143589583 n=1 Tax=Bidens hawaiensis TaxID=980011 RepID=UPI004049C922
MADIIDECISLYDSAMDADGTTETCFIFDRLQVEMDKQLEEEEKKLKEASKVELMELPRHLKYAFLGKNDTLLVIIASNLSLKQETTLLEVLVANKEAIGWTIVDLKGISPLIVMHKILEDPDVKPAHDAQMMLNLNMREVVKKEVLKWPDARITFAISDNTWVIPIKTVQKKAGIQVVMDDSSNEVATRPVTELRICIDYPKLNTATSKDHFPLPFIDQIVEKLSGQKFYCFLDGYLGYNQIAIHPEDHEKTMFTCPWEKSHFIVQEGFVLSHVVLRRRIEVDRAKDAPFDFNDERAKAFDILKQKLVEAPVLQSPDWNLPFEIMCDATDYAVGAVWGQRVEKRPVALYYKSKTLSDAQLYYTTTEKEYLMDKKDAKQRLIRWVLL